MTIQVSIGVRGCNEWDITNDIFKDWTMLRMQDVSRNHACSDDAEPIQHTQAAAAEDAVPVPEHMEATKRPQWRLAEGAEKADCAEARSANRDNLRIALFHCGWRFRPVCVAPLPNFGL
ncbi:MAG TPA: hypothetical protein VNW97_20170 [Candidatus Saccharimonadales bacterium]|jgi:hypothetical protein|nr:hypothetical protein [Candidatus Saccharimonadales bacterium]